MNRKLFLLLCPAVLIAVNVAVLENLAEIDSAYGPQVLEEFFGMFILPPYTVFALTGLFLVLVYWFKKPGIVSLLFMILTIFGLCGAPALHLKNNILYGSSKGWLMQDAREFEMRSLKLGQDQGQALPIYLDW